MSATSHKSQPKPSEPLNPSHTFSKGFSDWRGGLGRFWTDLIALSLSVTTWE